MENNPKSKDKKIKMINVSFRDTKKDNLIYDEIIKHSSKGGFIKDVLYSAILRIKGE